MKQEMALLSAPHMATAFISSPLHQACLAVSVGVRMPVCTHPESERVCLMGLKIITITLDLTQIHST